jgi:hypothetical protein
MPFLLSPEVGIEACSDDATVRFGYGPSDGSERGAAMDSEQYVVWITTRRIRDGTYEEFRKAWRPKEFPEGMLRAYECYSEDSNEVVGISTWDSFESRERYRTSDVEAARREAMAPYVEAESSGLYVGRELKVPKA